MKNRKFGTLVCVLLMTFGLVIAGCGGDDTNDSVDDAVNQLEGLGSGDPSELDLDQLGDIAKDLAEDPEGAADALVERCKQAIEGLPDGEGKDLALEQCEASRDEIQSSFDEVDPAEIEQGLKEAEEALSDPEVQQQIEDAQKQLEELQNSAP